MTRPKLSQPQDTVCLLQIWLNIAVIACSLLLTTPACHLHPTHLSPALRDKLILIKKAWFGVYLLLNQGRGSSFKVLSTINFTKMKNKLVAKFGGWCIQSWASG